MKKLKLFLFAIIAIFLFSSKVNATSIEMYQDQALTIYGYQECTLAKCWDRYKNVKYDGQLYSLNFYSGVSISPLDKYTLTINFRGDDFISSKKDDVAIYNDTSCSVISTQTDGNEYSTYLKIAFVCGQSSNYFKVNVGGLGEEPITGVINYGITGLDIVNETAQDTDKIIAGNDKNTDNIINNNNNNTNTIIDKNKENTDKILDSNKDTQNVIKDQFNSCRDSANLLDLNFISQTINGLTITNNGNGSYTFNGTTSDIISFRFSKEMNNLYLGTYTLSLNSTGSVSTNFNTIIWAKNDTAIQLTNTFLINNNSVSFNTDVDYKLYYLWIYIKSGTVFKDFTFYPMLNKGSTAIDYEPFGEKICTNKLDEQNKTSKNIWETIKSFPSTFSNFFTDLGDKIGKFFDNLLTGIINGIKSLFVPEDFSFINNFKTTLENKLGFIASIPIQMLDYLLSLKDKAFSPMNTISFPKISIFGYYFWDNIEIDITKGLGWISAFKYFTDITCVIIMVNTLKKWYVNFTGGDEK